MIVTTQLTGAEQCRLGAQTEYTPLLSKPPRGDGQDREHVEGDICQMRPRAHTLTAFASVRAPPRPEGGSNTSAKTAEAATRLATSSLRRIVPGSNVRYARYRRAFQDPAEPLRVGMMMMMMMMMWARGG
ncbi:unnamed protein product [Prorocentrum cordatum]|uniref:Uncharacterized protein n=1 Tax=Prorocentrum cordatum TaxID=2364126 RepID=A0ABN9RWR1_9DINO|nr:unnamed protein product [Polarella glacialis]